MDNFTMPLVRLLDSAIERATEAAEDRARRRQDFYDWRGRDMAETKQEDDND